MESKKIKLRFWIRYRGKILRFLGWENYEPCYYGGSQKSFIFRLPPGDKRRRGMHHHRGEYDAKTAAWFAQFPVGRWIEISQ
jgi:hypothetical protein